MSLQSKVAPDSTNVVPTDKSRDDIPVSSAANAAACFVRDCALKGNGNIFSGSDLTLGQSDSVSRLQKRRKLAADLASATHSDNERGGVLIVSLLLLRGLTR